MRKPTGHIRPHGAGFEVAVTIGRDPITKRYSYAYEQAATLEEAEKTRARMLADLEKGRAPRTEATFGQLIDEVLEVISLDFTTLGMYQGYIERTIRPALAEYGACPSTRTRPAMSRGSLQDAARVGLVGIGGGMYRIHPALPGYLAVGWHTDSPDGASGSNQITTVSCGGCVAAEEGEGGEDAGVDVASPAGVGV
jgi:hypothetical protein